jgi:hypothetical protein
VKAIDPLIQAMSDRNALQEEIIRLRGDIAKYRNSLFTIAYGFTQDIGVNSMGTVAIDFNTAKSIARKAINCGEEA